MPYRNLQTCAGDAVNMSVASLSISRKGRDDGTRHPSFSSIPVTKGAQSFFSKAVRGPLPSIPFLPFFRHPVDIRTMCCSAMRQLANHVHDSYAATVLSYRAYAM